MGTSFSNRQISSRTKTNNTSIERENKIIVENRLDLLITGIIKIRFFVPPSIGGFRNLDIDNNRIYYLNTKYIDKSINFLADGIFIYNNNILVLYKSNEYKLYGVRYIDNKAVLILLGGQKLVTNDVEKECLYDLNFYYKLDEFELLTGGFIIADDRKIYKYFAKQNQDKVIVHKYLTNVFSAEQNFIIHKELHKINKSYKQ